MKRTGNAFPNVMLMTLLGGAALGGFAVAFTATKTGKEFRDTLRALASRFNLLAGPSDQAADQAVPAAFI